MHELVTIVAKYFIALPVVAIAAIFLTLDKKRRLEFIVYAALAGILTLIFVKIATTIHQDPRPFVRDGVVPYFSSSQDNGFPSDHTALSALVAGIVVRYNRKLGIALFLLAALIGASRVIAGVHHGQDIAGGLAIAALGCACAFGIQRFMPTAPKSGKTNHDGHPAP